MKKYLCVFALLIALATTQPNVGVNQMNNVWPGINIGQGLNLLGNNNVQGQIPLNNIIGYQNQIRPLNTYQNPSPQGKVDPSMNLIGPFNGQYGKVDRSQNGNQGQWVQIQNGKFIGWQWQRLPFFIKDREYRISESNNLNPYIRIKFMNDQVTLVNGCNNLTSSLKVDQKIKSIKFGPFSKPLRTCEFNYDTFYTNFLTNSVAFQIQGNKMVLKDSRGFNYVNITEYKPLSATPVSLVGKYSTNLLKDSGITLEFTNNQVNLVGGCNSQSANYSALSNGSFTLSPFSSTLKACSTDSDSILTKALTSSISVKKYPGGLIRLKDSSGYRIILQLTRIPLAARASELGGTYKPIISSDPNFSITFEGSNRVTLNTSCNNPSGYYEVFEDKKLSFGPFQNTKIICSDKNDAVLTNALSKVVRYVVHYSSTSPTQRLILYSSQGKQIFTLIQTAPAPAPVPVGCNQPCLYGSYCQNGQCVYPPGYYLGSPKVDKCANINCPLIGTKCKNGECVPMSSCQRVMCQFGQICQQGFCFKYERNVDQCNGVICPQGLQCRFGFCEKTKVAYQVSSCSMCNQPNSFCVGNSCIIEINLGNGR